MKQKLNDVFQMLTKKFWMDLIDSKCFGIIMEVLNEYRSPEGE